MQERLKQLAAKRRKPLQEIARNKYSYQQQAYRLLQSIKSKVENTYQPGHKNQTIYKRIQQKVIQNKKRINSISQNYIGSSDLYSRRKKQRISPCRPNTEYSLDLQGSQHIKKYLNKRQSRSIIITDQWQKQNKKERIQSLSRLQRRINDVVVEAQKWFK